MTALAAGAVVTGALLMLRGVRRERRDHERPAGWHKAPSPRWLP